MYERVMVMTLKDVVNMDKAYLTPAEAAEILECDPHAIRIAAKKAPEQLRFPTILIGNRVKIPRLPFVEFMTKLKGASV